MSTEPPSLAMDERGARGVFRAMASPWEVLVAGADAGEIAGVTAVVAEEVGRIEHKYSRYRGDGLVQRINRAEGKAVAVDAETARLLDYADALWRSSEALFDITTGVLRRAWRFDGSGRVPTQAQIEALLPFVGWDKVEWDGERLRLPAGMEIDFGGIGKEYAVDRALALAATRTQRPVLVNGGGDLAANAAPAAGQPWRIGIDGGDGAHAPGVQLFHGAVATSGDAHRHLVEGGRRYGHVLDPRSGWPVADAPASVTVLAASCCEAGSHSTIALLKGRAAEQYLRAQNLQHRVRRDPV